MLNNIGYFRRKSLINKKFQLGITSYFLSFYFIALIALYLFVRFTINANVEHLKDLDPLNFSTLDLFMENTVDVLNFAFFVFGAIGGFFAFVGGVIVSGKVAGPLVRLQKIIQQMTARNYKGSFQVRKNDFCGELYDDLEKLEKSLTSDQAKSD